MAMCCTSYELLDRLLMSYLIQCTGFLYIGKWNTFETWNSRRVFGVFFERARHNEQKENLSTGLSNAHISFGGKTKLVWYITNKREIAYHFYLLFQQYKYKWNLEKIQTSKILCMYCFLCAHSNSNPVK